MKTFRQIFERKKPINQKTLNPVEYAPGEDALINKNVRKRRMDSVAGESYVPEATAGDGTKRHRSLYAAGLISKDELNKRLGRGKHTAKGPHGTGSKTGDKMSQDFIKKTIRHESAYSKQMDDHENAKKSQQTQKSWKIDPKTGKKVWNRTGEPVEEAVEELDEILNVSQRIARARSLKKNKAKIAMGKRRQAHRIADKDRLKDRATRHARTALVKRITKGISKSDLSPQRRAEIERRLARMKGRIDVISKKMLPQVRKDEIAKKRGRNDSKPQKADKPRVFV